VTGRFRSARQFGRGSGQGSGRGFTIVELLVVMALIAILSTIAIAQYRQSVQFTKESVLKDDLAKMRDAIDQYYADKNSYPPTLDDLVTAGYIRALPKDPITNETTSWQGIPGEPDPANPSTVPGIYDVKSGAEGTAIDGTNYNDW
jgi:general secretion pathway protein G